MCSDRHDASVQPAQPRAPAQIACAVCRREIPPQGGLAREFDDYTLWFCGLDCHTQWQHGHEGGDPHVR
ncbi:MAG TPA: DUF3330 domain-containing protein [Gammaproteobacteria bacterium]